MSGTEAERRERLAKRADERAAVCRARLEGMDERNKAFHAYRKEASDFEAIASLLRTPPTGTTEQRCPVCGGHGFLNYPPGIAHNQEFFTASGSGPWPCHRCEGKGTITPTGTTLPERPPDAWAEAMAEGLLRAYCPESGRRVTTWPTSNARSNAYWRRLSCAAYEALRLALGSVVAAPARLSEEERA